MYCLRCATRLCTGPAMRRAPATLSRLNAAQLAAALFALTLMTISSASAKSPMPGSGASSSTPAASGEIGNSVAYAVPRDAPAPDTEIILPQPLPPSAVAQYKRILALQAQGKFAAADRIIARLDDGSLLGPVLADRYLDAGYHSSSAELLHWYEQYNNQPDAAAIYQLLLKKLPPGAVPPLAPQLSLLPEARMTAGAAAKPAANPDGVLWRARFMSGVAAWRRGDIAKAGPIFMRAATMPHSSADDRAAGAFWAARAALRLQQPMAYLQWLQRAAAAPDSFYGILAGRLLGQGFSPAGAAATLTEADITAVDAAPDGHLAFGLLQLGEPARAATALRALYPDIQNNPDLARAVMTVAAHAGMVDVTIAISSALPNPIDAIAGAHLPLPALHPAGGFTVDPSLVYALTRTESGFDVGATSPAGARGLMQLMPDTAGYIGRNNGISGDVANPAANLALGQAYIRYLGQQSGIAGNLLAVLASYNAGPGNAAAWVSGIHEGSDPLVFLETIPNDETRRFVRQVLADSWIYAEEIGLQPASLDALARGNFPRLSLNTAGIAAN